MDTSTAFIAMANTLKKQQEEIDNLKKIIDNILEETSFTGIESKYQFV